MKFNLLSTNCATLQVNCSEQTERPRPVDSNITLETTSLISVI